jgi:hypothetical protein
MVSLLRLRYISMSLTLFSVNIWDSSNANSMTIGLSDSANQFGRAAVMTGQESAERKPRKVGTISLLVAKKMNGWDDYMVKSAAFTKAKHEMEDAKDAVKEALKAALMGKNLPGGARVQDDTNLDFTVIGHEVRIIEQVQKKGGRARSNDDLSVFF